MSDLLRGKHRPECPHCEGRVEARHVCLRMPDESEPFVKGWFWKCGQCLAQGPVKRTEAEAWESLRTLNAIQLEHYRAWHKALSEAQGGPCAEWMGRVLLEDCGLAFCECGDLCPEEKITRDGDGVELCPPCWAALIEECEASKEKDGA